MKKIFVLILVLIIFLTTSVLVPVFAESADSIAILCDNPNAARNLMPTEYTADYGVFKVDVGDPGGNGMISYDERERALTLTADLTKEANNRYFCRLNFNAKNNNLAFSLANYPYVRIKYKLEAENSNFTLALRDNGWRTVNLVTSVPTGVWHEAVSNVSGKMSDDVDATKVLRLQLNNNSTAYDIYQDSGFKFSVQYLIFFKNEADANSYVYTPTDLTTLPGYEPETGRQLVIPFDYYTCARGLSDRLNDFYIWAADFGAADTAVLQYDENEKAVYVGSAGANPSYGPFIRYRFLGYGSASMSGRDYRYMQIKFKITNSQEGGDIRLRSANWEDYILVSSPKLDEWVTLTVDMPRVKVGTNYLWTDFLFNVSNRISLQYNTPPNFNITEQPDLRFYIQYIAFFQSKKDAENFEFTTTSNCRISAPAGVDLTEAQVHINGIDSTSDVIKSADGIQFPLKDDVSQSTVQLLVPAGAEGAYDNYVYFVKKNGSGFSVEEQPELKNMLGYVGTAIRLNAELGQGLRVKSSLLLSVRNSGTYTILEYGTLAKRNDNPNVLQYIPEDYDPAAKIGKGVAFDGTEERIFRYGDAVLEFTTVLINIAPSNYKTDYDFRAYCVIEADGQKHVIYGETVTKNIFGIAQAIKEDVAYYNSLSESERAYIDGILAQ